ncbi:MAG: hypothetical protein JXM69_16225 [Anaerolineae bacterium]|nr:hypothetical protein [Anaerolineae bacterium]
MGFLNSLKSLFAGSGGADTAGYWIYVRCHRCGEVIATRLDLRSSLSERDEGGYVVHKTLIGNQFCFQRIEVTLNFDQNRRLLDREISHGEFVSKEEYEAAQARNRQT